MASSENTGGDAAFAVHGAGMDWERTSLPGVSRKVLARPDEAGLDATLMRLDSGTAMPTMETRARMEIFVTDGVYKDEAGDHPAGSLVVYPPGHAHTPASDGGCTLFIRQSGR